MSMEPQFRFCTSADGTRIAYAIYGSGPALVYARSYTRGMHALFPMPEARSYLDALAARATLVTFDRRGTGGSARTVNDLSVEAEARDIAAVVDAAGFDRFTLYAEGSAVGSCALYATEYQTRIDRLVVWPNPSGDNRELARLFRQDWSYGRRVAAGAVYPDGPVSLQREFSRAMKDTLSAEMAARYMEMLAEADSDVLLPAVLAPALVLSRQQIAAMRESAVRLAGLLPNSELRFVTGNARAPFPGHEPVVDAIFEFMGLGDAAPADAASDAPAPSAPSSGAIHAILFTDIVSHTEMMQRLGDAKGRAVLREHERITRETLKQHAGAEVKTDGDSFMASFASVSSAVECAVALQRAFAEYSATADEPIVVRSGLNVGEPIEEDGDYFGSAVILGARIKDQAAGGEILVPEAVRHLLAGKDFLFSDRGEIALRGFEDPVRLYEVRWRETGA
jgi:class 3 adenylate cyclase